MSETTTPELSDGTTGAANFDAVIVGAGFAGLYMLHRLRELGFSARVLEAADGVGGTWYWNRYPGARCDVESLEYQYGFEDELPREWKWTERYASQPEILRYLNHVADRYDLRRDIQFETRVTKAVFNESTERWEIETEQGERLWATYCIMATGCLSAPKKAEFKGLDSFEGAAYYTAYWPHEGVDFKGKTVGVIGTGSSAIQAIPIIAEQAAHLTVFQRTANFSVPAHNGPIDPEYQREMTEHYTDVRRRARETTMGGIVSVTPGEKSALSATEEERSQEFEARWRKGGLGFGAAFVDLIVVEPANDTVAEFLRSKIRQTVKDPATAELLCPRDYPFGTKRPCVDTRYFETFNRDNVTLVDVKNSPIEEITPTGLRTQGAEYEFECVVFATGFDAMTGALLSIDIRGRSGRSLKQAWESGPRTYLGLQVVGFPNLFTITGPGSPSVLTNMIVSIEQHVDWIADCVNYLREHGLSIEATVEAQDEWVDHVNMVANFTLFPRANSWYVGANVPGKPRVFMPYIGGLAMYTQKCKEVASKSYEGFVLKATNPERAATA